MKYRVIGTDSKNRVIYVGNAYDLDDANQKAEKHDNSRRFRTGNTRICVVGLENDSDAYNLSRHLPQLDEKDICGYDSYEANRYDGIRKRIYQELQDLLADKEAVKATQSRWDVNYTIDLEMEAYQTLRGIEQTGMYKNQQRDFEELIVQCQYADDEIKDA